MKSFAVAALLLAYGVSDLALADSQAVTNSANGLLGSWHLMIRGISVTLTFQRAASTGDLAGVVSSTGSPQPTPFVAHKAPGGYSISFPNGRGYNQVRPCGAKLCANYYREFNGKGGVHASVEPVEFDPIH